MTDPQRPSAEDIERCEFALAVIADIANEMDEDETQGEEAHEYHETADALRRLIDYAKGTP